MQYKISKDFNGVLVIWGFKCTFSFANGFSLEIRPNDSVGESFKEKCKELRGNFDELDWIYAVDTWGKNVAFHPSAQQGIYSYFKGTLSLVIDIFLCGYDSDTFGRVADIPVLKLSLIHI